MGVPSVDRVIFDTARFRRKALHVRVNVYTKSQFPIHVCAGFPNIPIMGIIVPIMGIKKTTDKAVSKHGAKTVPKAASLADALFSGTQQRVLGLLFGQPGRSYYATELINLAGVGSGGVQRELERLTQSGLVTVRAIGKQKHYQANPESPIFAELCSVTEKTSGLAEPLREALQPLAPQIAAAFIYGSIAKRQDTATSDVDLMIISDTLGYGDFYTTIETVSARLGRPLNPTIYTGKEFAKRVKEGHSFVKRVMEQPKVWLIGGEDAIAIRKSVRAKQTA